MATSEDFRWPPPRTSTWPLTNDAVDDLLALPIVLYPATPLLRRCWELRSNVTAYDACYVALAEALDVALLTADAKLANTPGTRCSFQLI